MCFFLPRTTLIVLFSAGLLVLRFILAGLFLCLTPFEKIFVATLCGVYNALRRIAYRLLSVVRPIYASVGGTC